MTGTCPSCRLEVPTVRGRIVEHIDGNAPPLPSGRGSSEQLCAGEGAVSIEQAIARRERARETARRRRCRVQRALVDRFRHHASVALDSLLERGAMPRELEADLPILLEVARYDMWFKTDPKVRARRSLPEALWRAVQQGDRRAVFGGTRGTWDVYCRLCGVIVTMRLRTTKNAMRAGVADSPALRQHVVPCALKHLAFDLQPVAPDVRRLPEHLLQEQPDAE